MSTSVASSHCVNCGDPVYATRFCESCGAKVEAENFAAVVPPAPVSMPTAPIDATPTASSAEPRRVDNADAQNPRVRLGLMLAFNAFIWTPVVPFATGWGVAVIGQSIGSWSLQSQMWPITVIAGIIAPAIMTLGFILAARSASISARARTWAIVLAVIAGLANALGAGTAGAVFGALSIAVPSLGAYAAIGAWGLIAQFRGPGYWALLYTFIASWLLYAAAAVVFASVLFVLVLALWVLAVVGVVKLALAQEKKAAAKPPRVFVARPGAPLALGRTNGFATASLVLALVGGGILAVVFGHVAHAQIRQTGESGSGMATAGLVIGYVSIVVSVIVTIIVGVSIGTGVWR